MNIKELTLDEIRYHIARLDLAQRMGMVGGAEMDALERQKQLFENELRLRTSIFVDRGFRGGV
jgi:hypothetical protein